MAKERAELHQLRYLNSPISMEHVWMDIWIYFSLQTPISGRWLLFGFQGQLQLFMTILPLGHWCVFASINSSPVKLCVWVLRV